MAAILRSVNFAQVIGRQLAGGRSVTRNFSSYRRRRSYESKGAGIGVVDVLIRCAGATLGCYFGYKVTGHWVPELEEKRQRIMREATGHSGEIEDLREKMWSDAKLVKKFSDLEKKMLSQLSGVSLERMWSDLREKIASDPRS
ncbi:BnaC06g40310D [Brassica napus]|uniref:BnaC06g40310D protein n=2 Tax=Brassica napus TaxID=3708 RepID=A0A078HT70_BRANA|nr:BnaC06g40310D [Brassica napus]